MAQLPTVGANNNTWGDVLNEYLSVSLDAVGAIRAEAIADKIGTIAGSPTTVTNVWVGTQGQYDSVSPKVATVLYFIQ
jgi:hypothetical protein